MVLEVRRTLRERALLFVVAWFFGSAGVLVIASRAPSSLFASGAAEGVVVLSVIAGLLAGFGVDAMVAASIHAIRVARLGSAKERSALLQMKTSDSKRESAAIALVALEHGDVSVAAAIIDRWSHHKDRTTIEELAVLRYDLSRVAVADRPKLLDKVVDWRASSVGAHAVELERYAAFTVAWHHDAGPLADRTQRIARRLLASRDEQVRGYGAWLAIEIEDLPNRATASPDFAMGAALAKHHGRTELAALLDARASKLLAGATPTAYRD
jgi:hypothetical protein